MAESKRENAQTETIKIESPSGKRRPNVTVLVENELSESAHNFADFVREYAVVGLAVGFIVGQQANNVVKQLVATFVDPAVQILFGQDLSTRTATFHHAHQPVIMPWGLLVYDLCQFFFVLIFVYVVIKLFNLNRLKKQDQKK